jgi:aminomethyltransferase
MEKLVVGDIRNCPSGEGFLSLILNDKAGIIDDTIITNFGDHIHMVVNGSNKFIDLEHMK